MVGGRRIRGLELALHAAMKTIGLLISLLCVVFARKSFADVRDLKQDEQTVLPQWRLALRAAYFQPRLAAADRAPFATSFGARGGLIFGMTAEKRIAYSARFGTATISGSLDVLYMKENARKQRDLFRLIPVTVMIGWRATQLADHYLFPLVPFINIGAGYSRWTSIDYDNELFGRGRRLRHGSRWHGSAAIGVSLRAEDIDPDSARSMREFGIEHSGFFVELRTLSGTFGGTSFGTGVEFEF